MRVPFCRARASALRYESDSQVKSGETTIRVIRNRAYWIGYTQMRFSNVHLEVGAHNAVTTDGVGDCRRHSNLCADVQSGRNRLLPTGDKSWAKPGVFSVKTTLMWSIVFMISEHDAQTITVLTALPENIPNIMQVILCKYWDWALGVNLRYRLFHDDKILRHTKWACKACKANERRI